MDIFEELEYITFLGKRTKEDAERLGVSEDELYELSKALKKRKLAYEDCYVLEKSKDIFKVKRGNSTYNVSI